MVKRIQKKKDSVDKSKTKNAPRNDRFWIIAFAVIAFLVYANTLDHEYALDDFPVIYGNSLTMQGIEGIPQMLKTAYWFGLDGQNNFFYRPLSLITYAIEWELAPNNPSLGHWTNALLYAFICGLLFMLLRKMFAKQNLFIPFIATLWFLVHPLHTEVVANIKSRDELLCLLLFLSNGLVVFSFLEKESKVKLLGIASLSFLSLMAKESAITFVAIIPLMIWFFSGANFGQNLKISGVALLGSLVYLLIRSQILNNQLGAEEIKLIDNTLSGASSVWVQWGTAFYIMALYLKLLVVPYPLASDYSFNHIELVNFSNPIALLSLLLHLLAFIWALKNIKSKSPLSFGILFYLVTISLVTNILFLTHSTMADRFLFIPSIGISILIALGFSKVFKVDTAQAIPDKSLFKKYRVPILVMGAIGIVYSSMAIQRNKDWKNDYTLFSADVLHAPNSSRIHYLYGNHLVQSVKQNLVSKDKFQSFIDTAVVHLERSVEIHPGNVDATMVLGDAYGMKKMHKEAIATFEKALLLEPNDSRLLNNMGNTYFRMGDPDLAMKTFERALQVNSEDADAYNNMGAVLFGQQKVDAAQQLFIKAIQIRPNYFDALKNLGSCYGIQQNYVEAINAFLKADKVSPDNATLLHTIGVTYQLMGDMQNANVFLNRAYTLDPGLRR